MPASVERPRRRVERVRGVKNHEGNVEPCLISDSQAVKIKKCIEYQDDSTILTVGQKNHKSKNVLHGVKEV